MSSDNVYRFIFEEESIRGEFVLLEKTFQEITAQHDYPPAVSRLIGEILSIAALLTATIKFTGKLTVQFRGKGNLKLLLAQCDSEFHMRAVAKWDNDADYQSLLDSFEDGVLVITIDGGSTHTQYQGIVAWDQNLTKSIEGYFAQSEQLATKIWLRVENGYAAGLLLQIIPADKNKTTLEVSSQSEPWQRIIEKTDKEIFKADLFASNMQLLLNTLYPEAEIRLFSPNRIKFQCNCNRKRGEDAIIVLGEKEAEEELKEKQTIVVTCDFCNKEYVFDRVDVAHIFKTKPQDSKGSLH